MPESEMPVLFEAGVREVFGPGASREEIVHAVTSWGSTARRHQFARGGFDV